MGAPELVPSVVPVLRRFPVGYHSFTTNSHLNFELNRCYNAVGEASFADITAAGQRIKDFETYTHEMFALAEKAKAAGDIFGASMYLRNAEFFMDVSDPRKQPTYEEFRRLFNQVLPQVHESRFLVPYASGFLPGWHLKPEGKIRGTLLVHGGFDSFLEELYMFMPYLQTAGFEIYAFEGPGQGAALKDYHLPMTHEWEKPVKAVLDHFRLDGVTLIGISLGGYLASRAAAFEPRVKRLVTFDVLYDFFESAMRTQPPVARLALRTLVKLKAKGLVNAVARWSASRDIIAQWGLPHGLYVFGVETPFEFFECIMKMTLKGVAPLITQESWLCAGESDHMVPLEMLKQQQAEMVNAAAVHTRVFTDAEHAGSHCQIGNIKLAMDYLIQSLDPQAN